MNDHEQNALGSEAGLGEDSFTDMSKLMAYAVERISRKNSGHLNGCHER